MNNIQEKAEQYAIDRLGNWGHIVHSAYETEQSTNGEVTAQDYTAGYDFAMVQPKHIFDGVAQVGEVRRFEGGIVDVVRKFAKPSTCCILFDIENMNKCMHLTFCDINNVKYIKRV